MKYAAPEEFESFIRLKLEELNWQHPVDIGLEGDTLVVQWRAYIPTAQMFAKFTEWLADSFGCFLIGHGELGCIYRFEDR